MLLFEIIEEFLSCVNKSYTLVSLQLIIYGVCLQKSNIFIPVGIASAGIARI